MEDKKTKSIDLERIFTRQDYKNFKQAVEAREFYEFRLCKSGTYFPDPATGIYIHISGRECANGVWQDNYLYALNFGRGTSGCGLPFDPVQEGILPYERIIQTIYGGLKIPPPQTTQMSIFDMEM